VASSGQQRFAVGLALAEREGAVASSGHQQYRSLRREGRRSQGRNARTTDAGTPAGTAGAPPSASTTECGASAGTAGAPPSASTADGDTSAGTAGAPPCASTADRGAGARHAAAPLNQLNFSGLLRDGSRQDRSTCKSHPYHCPPRLGCACALQRTLQTCSTCEVKRLSNERHPLFYFTNSINPYSPA
jgi:hypothetical protein